MGRAWEVWQKAARGFASQAAVAAQFGAIGVFNDSAEGRYLVIRGAAPSGLSGAIQGGAVSSAKIGAGDVRGAPVYALGEALPGLIEKTTVASLPTLDWGASSSNGLQLVFEYFPLVILPQGFQYTFYATLVNTLFEVSFYWQILTRDELNALDLEGEN